MKDYLKTLALMILCSSCYKTHIENVNPVEMSSQDSTMISENMYTEKDIYVGHKLTNNPLCSQLVIYDDEEKYCMLDMGYIYIYDWCTCILEDSIDTSSCGTLTNFSGFYVHRSDSIYIYNYGINTLFLINHEGYVQNKWIIPGYSNHKNIYTDVNALNGSRIIANKNSDIILSGFIYGDLQNSPDEKECASIMISHQNNKLLFGIKYPDLYYEANWGGVHMNKVYHCYDYVGNVLYSYPIEHFVYKYNNLFECCDTLYMGSRYTKTIKSCGTSFLKLLLDKDAQVRYYISSNSYGPIVYDDNRELYYRVAYHPLEKCKDLTMFSLPFSIILSDKKGDVLSESSIFRSYEGLYLSNMHACREGLAIAYHMEDEDKLSFKIYSINKNRK